MSAIGRAEPGWTESDGCEYRDRSLHRPTRPQLRRTAVPRPAEVAGVAGVAGVPTASSETILSLCPVAGSSDLDGER